MILFSSDNSKFHVKLISQVTAALLKKMPMAIIMFFLFVGGAQVQLETHP